MIERLSRDMDARLNELAAGEQTAEVRWIRRENQPVPMPEKELADVEKAVTEAGQTPESFWKRFKKAAHEDLCEEGGVLHAQWKRFGDLSDEKVLEQFGERDRQGSLREVGVWDRCRTVAGKRPFPTFSRLIPTFRRPFKTCGQSLPISFPDRRGPIEQPLLERLNSL